MAQLEGMSVMVVEEKARLPRQNSDDDQLISEMAPGQGYEVASIPSVD